MMKRTKIPARFPVSTKLGHFDEKVESLKQKYLQLWEETDCSLPQFYKTYCPKEQQKLEHEMSNYIEEKLKNKEQYLSAKKETELAFNEDVFVKSLYIEKLSNLSAIYLDDNFTDGFKRATKLFLNKAKQFDPSLTTENIYQALRNVWIMNSLQIYLNQQMDCSDSIFAYSMLYPYTDNIMDDVAASVEEKLKMNRNLQQWLEGKSPPYQNETEKKIDALVKLIERQFPRDNYPNVFPSILTIYNAQIKSLFQQKQHHSPCIEDILNISFEKGGTSVLADGYLITGDLKECHEDFCFGYGVFLQLADDIQDIINDKNNQHITLFSQFDESKKLDVIANKLFNFITAVIKIHLSEPIFKDLKDLILRNCYLLVIEAIGENRDLYSDDYANEIESHFPFRFCYLNDLKQKLKNIAYPE